jgi:hypothetical protein
VIRAAFERFGDRREPTLADFHLDGRIGQQVVGPRGAIAGGDQDRTIRLVDVADRDPPRQTRASSACRQPGDLALEEQVAADVVRREARQRARCQDLPSVWVDGA